MECLKSEELELCNLTIDPIQPMLRMFAKERPGSVLAAMPKGVRDAGVAAEFRV
jgi:hypothetical protein